MFLKTFPRGNVLLIINMATKVHGCALSFICLAFNEDLCCSEGLMGVHHMVYRAITSSDTDLRKDLYSNIIVTGGNTLIPNFSERLHKELSEIAPQVGLLAPCLVYPLTL